MHHLFNKKQHFCLLFWIGLANNPLANVEVVSSLNAFNLGHYTYHYYSKNCIKKYNPKVYLGTTQTVALYWYSDDGFSEKMTWPQAFQGSQKGEANISNSII